MNSYLSRSIFALTVALTAFSFGSPHAAAQSDADLKWYQGGTYNSQSEVDAMYRRNAQRPLAGLFAPRFTRTLTLLGGANFLSDNTAADFGGQSVVSPLLPASREVDNNGYALSFAFGRRHNHSLRSEIEVGVRGNDIDQIFEDVSTEDGTVTATSIMKNFIVDFNNNSRFTPYAGVGIGISYVDVKFGEATSVDGETTGGDGESLFSYQAIGGVATELTAAADFIVEYRFLGTSEVEFNGLNQELTYNTSSLFLGVKFEY